MFDRLQKGDQMKNKDDKRVNESVKRMNKIIRADVYGNRFEARQIEKTRYTDCHDIHCYRYLLIDNEQPERNRMTKVYNVFEICNSNKLWIEMNDFIVDSDFWKKHK